MKDKLKLFLASVAAGVAIQFAIVDDKQDIEMSQKIYELTEENTLLIERIRQEDLFGDVNRQDEIDKTAAKMESDLRVVMKEAYEEDMNINVEINELVAGEFQATIGVATALPTNQYATLTKLVEETITMDDVRVLIVGK